MANSSTLSLNIDSFDGDPTFINYFFDTVKQYAQLKNLSQEETVLLLKSKLKGPALKYLLEDPILYKATDFEFIQNKFTKFFSKSSSSTTLADLNALAFLPQESVKNFAHRLNFLTRTVYATIQDPEAINHIKYVKLMSSLPVNIKIKILEENLKDYNKVVERAQELQEILMHEQLIPIPTSQNSFDSFQSQIALLTEKVNNMTFVDSKGLSKNKDESVGVRPKQHFSRYQNYRQNFKSRNVFHTPSFRKHSQNEKNAIRCQLCHRFNHTALSCFKWQRKQLDHRDDDIRDNYRQQHHNNQNNNNYRRDTNRSNYSPKVQHNKRNNNTGGNLN